MRIKAPPSRQNCREVEAKAVYAAMADKMAQGIQHKLPRYGFANVKGVAGA